MRPSIRVVTQGKVGKVWFCIEMLQCWGRQRAASEGQKPSGSEPISCDEVVGPQQLAPEDKL